MDRSENVSGLAKLLAGGVAGATETFVTVGTPRLIAESSV